MVGKEDILTPQECRLVIKRYLQSEEFEVLQFQQEIDPTGSNSYHAIAIKILFDKANQVIQFVAKRPKDSFGFHIKDAWAKEVFSHELLFKAFKDKNENFDLNFTPKCCFTKDDVILFEDPFKQGFDFPEHAKSLDIGHIKLVLQTLAGYHAGSIAFEEKKSKQLGRQYRLKDEYEFPQTSIHVFESTWFKSRLKDLEDLVHLLPQDKLTHEEFKKGLLKIAAEAAETLKGSKFRNVLCHGYMWENNMLFKDKNKAKPQECRLINFELQHYNPPALDVLQFIYNVTNRETRKQHFHECLQFYYDCLKHQLSLADLNTDELIPWEDFELSVHSLLPVIKLQAACFRQLQVPKPSSLYEDPFVIEAFKTNEDFRSIIGDCIMELQDLIMHPNLSVEDCFQIIEKKIGTKNYELLDYQLTPLSTISGYLGDHNKLRIDISINNERKTLKLFAKFVPKTDTAIRVSNDTDAFYKEIFMYQNFVPKMQSFGINIIEDCVVPCYFTRQNDVLVFDDFEFLNYRTQEPRKPYSYELMQVVVRNMAKYHASSIILEEKLSEKTGTTFLLKDHYPRELQESLLLQDKDHHGAQVYTTGVNMVDYEMDLLSMSDKDLKLKIKKAYELAYELTKPSTEFRNVICHGDLWISNILAQHVDGVPTDSRFIDFQICRYCPPAHDLLTFMHLSTNQKTRRQHSESLINLYYEELSRNLKAFGCDVEKIYPYDNFMKSIEYMTPQAVCQTVVYYQLVLINSDILKEHTADEESLQNVMVGDRRKFLSDMFQRDPFFKERTLEALQDLEEMCLKYF